MTRFAPFGSLTGFLGLLLLLLFIGCDKGDKDPNQEPDTRIALEKIDLSGEDRLNSIVTLNWFGSDKDGFVIGYELSFDGESWEFVTVSDSTFVFSIQAGSDTVDIDFFVRAVDDQEDRDPSPAYLSIPLKNTAPTVVFDMDLLPQDTVNSVLSLSWTANDLDGVQTIDSTLIRINGGPWYPLNQDADFVSLIPENPDVAGSGNALVYYGSTTPETNLLSGIVVGDTNRIEVKVVDIAGSSSIPASAGPFFVRAKTSDLLVIGANAATPAGFYSSIINNVYTGGFDFVDYGFNAGENQPRFWNPSFKLLISLYDKVFLYSDQTTYTDAQTSQDQLVLEFGASALQEYLNEGGKAFITTSLPANLATTSSVFQTMPMDSLSSASGQATMNIDTTLTAQEPEYDDLRTSEFVLGLDPFYPTADAEVMYTAGLTANGGWTGPGEIAARRKLNGNINQVFFAIELHKVNNDPTALNDLFDQILNNDFNW